MGTRERRLVFGEDAEQYDRARPSYPAELVDDLVSWVGANARVVDVGCGTAKGTRLLAERGMTGVGVEAHPAMAAVARSHLAPYTGWRVDVSDFETWRPATGDVPADMVTAAQAWHWVDTPAGLRKAHELLRPGGWLAVWWNLVDDEHSEVRQEIDAVYAEVAPGEVFSPALVPLQPERSPFEPHRDRQGIGSDDGHPVFEPPVQHDYRWTRTYTTAEMLDLLVTQSNHRLMPPDLRERVLVAVAAAVDRHGGTYDYPYVSRLWATRRA